MIELAQLLLILFGFVIMPIVLVVATPFVLFWPRPTENSSYVKTVGQRYLRIIDVLCHLGNAIG